MDSWILGSWGGNAALFVTGIVMVWAGWITLRWRKYPERYGHRLEAAVGRQLGARSPRGLDRTFVPISWWSIVLGVAFILAVTGLALVRWSVLPESAGVASAMIVFAPAALGLVAIGVMRLTGPPASMRLVPRDPTSARDLLRQLALARSADGPPRQSSASEPDGAPPTSFVSERTGSPIEVRIAVRADVSDQERYDLVEALRVAPWADLRDAYGPATDVLSLLYAVTVGTDRVRREAWWGLWGGVYHQGTVYEVTPWCVVYLAQLAADPGHPDRVNALGFLRSIALGDGVNASLTREAVEEQLPRLMAGWEGAPHLVRRALLLLVSAFPDRLAEYRGLTDQLPAELHPAWVELLSVSGRPSRLAMDGDRDDLMDGQDELERWALAGWYEAGDSREPA